MRAGSSVILDGAHRLQRGCRRRRSGARSRGVSDLPDSSRLEAAEGFRVVAVAEPGRGSATATRRLFFVLSCRWAMMIGRRWRTSCQAATRARSRRSRAARARTATPQRLSVGRSCASRLAGEADVKPLVEERSWRRSCRGGCGQGGRLVRLVR